MLTPASVMAEMALKSVPGLFSKKADICVIAIIFPPIIGVANTISYYNG
jgi:hypothetical protein